jgi:DNA-binding beta-propeller fold protein YncE
MRYQEIAGWGEETWDNDVTGVAVDSRDRVYALRRGKYAVTILDPNGTVLDRWGHECFSSRPHQISIGHDDKIYIADDGAHRLYVFDRDGRLLQTIGDGMASKTGYGEDGCPSADIPLEQVRGGAPFNRPTKVVLSPNGKLFASDGYRNCRVHRFSSHGALERSWGAFGADLGCFVIPHSVAIDSAGRVLVCDRENDRIQLFSQDGELLEAWDDVQRPTDVALDKSGRLFVTELPRGPKDLKSWRLGPVTEEQPGRVTIRSKDGAISAQLSFPEFEFHAPHALAVDTAGAIYVAEVPDSFAKYTGKTPKPQRCLRKFALQGEPA